MRQRSWQRKLTELAAIVLAIAIIGGRTTAAENSSTASDPIYVVDLTGLNQLDLNHPAEARRAWDTLHLVASLQGLVNRHRATLFVRFMKHPDDFWWEYLHRDGHWLARRPVHKIRSLAELLATFQKTPRGVVIYKEDVRATSNVASTLAGVEDRLCLRYDPLPGSIYSHVMASGLPFTRDVVRLFNEDGSPMFTGAAGSVIPGTGTPGIPSSGSAKCDAHLWAKHRVMDTRRVSPDYMAYYIDSYWLTAPGKSSLSNCTLTNHDFFIAQKAFFFDLHVWEEESPVDDPRQRPGTDVRTLKRLLRGMHDLAGGKVFHIGGFTPWAWKYTDHPGAGSEHGGVDSEWKYAQIISAYNGIMDADALGYSGMANASFYQHFPLEDHYPQNPRPTREDLASRDLIRPDGRVAPRAYVTFYMGDYDSAAWLNYFAPRWYQDPARGQIPCGWAFNPNLDRRAPHAMHLARTSQTAQDWFVAGDSGAGYLNPGMLTAPRLDPELPDGWEAWVAHNRPYFRRYDLSIVGFIIDGHSPGMGEKGLDAYMRFAPEGIVGQKIPPQGLHRDRMPYLRMKLDLDGSPQAAGAKIAGLVKDDLPQFMFIRTILKSPTWHQQTMQHAAASPGGERLCFLDPYSFFLLLKTHQRSGAE